MWVHPYTDMPLKVVVDFWEIGGMAESEQCSKVMVERLQSPVDCIPHPYHIYIQRFLVPLYAVDGHKSQPSHCYTCAGGSGF